MPEGKLRECWRGLPDSGSFSEGDRVYSLCHNCNNIIEEMHPGVEVHSLWELIDSDPAFSFADHHELKAYIQDCWRSRDRKDEQDAVRSLMKKMNIDIMELSGSREKTDFCGVSLYRAQPPRNPKLAPKHYVAGAAGKFIPQSPEEQEEIMPDLMKLKNMTETSAEGLGTTEQDVTASTVHRMRLSYNKCSDTVAPTITYYDAGGKQQTMTAEIISAYDTARNAYTSADQAAEMASGQYCI